MEDIEEDVEIYENDDYDIDDIIVQGDDKDINMIMKNYKRNMKKYKTIPSLTKYEKCKVLSERANQINYGCNILIEDYDKYEEQTRELILKQKLTEKLVRGNLKVAVEEDLKIYYENNLSKFKMASNVKAVQYTSKDKVELNKIIKNPMINIPGISRSPIDLDQTTINPQLRYIINETNINQFTPIFTSNKEFVTLLITRKDEQKTIAFEDVKDKIFNIVMQDREEKYLKDYFEKLKLSADIKIIR